MTFELTSERLQDISVSCVSKFVTKQASLSEAIAKEAQELELNSEQTKRVIETSNTLAYLRQLEKSADRTFEFEVADYNKVMGLMCMPDDMAKQAGTPPWLDKDKDGKEDAKEDDKGESKDKKDEDDSDEKKNKGEDFGKGEKSKTIKDSGEKSEAKDDSKEKSDGKDDSAKKDKKPNPFESKDKKDESEEQEKKAMLAKGYFSARAKLEKMAYDKIELHLQLSTASNKLHRDPLGYEKIAEVTTDEERRKVLALCGIEKTAGDNVVFKRSELTDAKTVTALLKQAQDLIAEEKKLQDFIKRAEAILFQKTANVTKLAAVGFMTKAVGSIAGKVTQGIGKVLGAGATKTGTLAGAGVKNVVMGTPFAQAAKARGYPNTGAAVKSYDKLVKTKGQAAADLRFRGTKPSLVANRIGVGGALTALGGAGMVHNNNTKDLNN